MSLLLVFSIAAVVEASPRADLIWMAEAETVACQELSLKKAVSRRLGYDPLDPGAPIRIVVAISGAETLTANIHVERTSVPNLVFRVAERHLLRRPKQTSPSGAVAAQRGSYPSSANSPLVEKLVSVEQIRESHQRIVCVHRDR